MHNTRINSYRVNSTNALIFVIIYFCIDHFSVKFCFTNSTKSVSVSNILFKSIYVVYLLLVSVLNVCSIFIYRMYYVRNYFIIRFNRIIRQYYACITVAFFIHTNVYGNNTVFIWIYTLPLQNRSDDAFMSVGIRT